MHHWYMACLAHVYLSPTPTVLGCVLQCVNTRAAFLEVWFSQHEGSLATMGSAPYRLLELCVHEPLSNPKNEVGVG